jgi:galactokinase
MTEFTEWTGVPATTSTAGRPATIRATSPGRVNLIGDHTDYNGGVALPMAVDLATEVTFTPDASRRIVLWSADDPEAADVEIDVPLDRQVIGAIHPIWARHVAAVVAAVRPDHGGRGTIRTDLPLGAGLSSSAALDVALALALGFRGDAVTMARTCQRAEEVATGVACGLMDQLVVAGAEPGAAMLVDFADITTRLVPLPPEAEIVVVHSGVSRRLETTAYAARRAECEAAAWHLGPLGQVSPDAVMGLPDALLRRRARHVVTECDRVRWVADCFRTGDLDEAGRLMLSSHRSLAEDFEASTPALDDLVADLARRPGVHGARATGAGFGGCVVALTEPGALDPDTLPTAAWVVQAAGRATATVLGS